MSKDNSVPEKILLETLALDTKNLGRIVPVLEPETGTVTFGFRIDGKCYTTKEILEMGKMSLRHVIKTLLTERLEQAKAIIEDTITEIREMPDED